MRYRRAEQSMPALAVVELDTGHAVNIEDATGFNAAVTRFFADAQKRYWTAQGAIGRTRP